MMEQPKVFEIFARYAEAVVDKNADAFLALYADDVIVFDAWNVWAFRGRDEWKKAVDTWFNSLEAGKMQVTFDELTIEEGEALAYATAIVYYAWFDRQSKMQGEMINRMSSCLRRSEDSWQIVHEHTSVPVDMSSGKGMVELS